MPDFTPETFADLFTREALRPFQPRPGTTGLTPMLEVHTPESVLVFVLALDDFNDWHTRRTYLAGLGAKCALEHGEVTAVRFGSEAWTKEFTAEEEAARGTRLVETYDDKEEVLIVVGQLVSGYTLITSARLHRRENGTVSHLGPWELAQYTTTRSPLLEAFWAGYQQGKGRDN